MGSTLFALLIILLGVFLFAILFANAFRIVPEYKRAVVFRLGRCVGALGPGLICIMPIIDQAILVDLREQTRVLQAQSAISADNVRLAVDITWNYRVSDPVKSLMAVANPDQTLQNAARQAWFSLVEAQTYSKILNNRPQVRAEILDQLQKTSAGWGIEISGVQLSEIRKGD